MIDCCLYFQILHTRRMLLIDKITALNKILGPILRSNKFGRITFKLLPPAVRLGDTLLIRHSKYSAMLSIIVDKILPTGM